MDPSTDGWIGTEEVARRYKALRKSASSKEMHCAMELCKLDGADPHKKIRGVALWMHYLGTVRNILTVTRLAREFEANADRS